MTPPRVSEPTDPEQRTWLTAWRDNDDAAGKKLYEVYSTDITLFFQSKVYDRHNVLDLVQQTFMSLQRSKTPVNKSVRAYVFGVARNVLQHYVRKVMRTKRTIAAAEVAADVGELPLNQFELDPEYVVNQQQELRLLGKALRRIKLDDQVMLELFYFKNLTRAELAEMFEIPAPAIASRVRRARERLTEQMLDLESDLYVLESTSKSVATWLAELDEHLKTMLKRKKR